MNPKIILTIDEIREMFSHTMEFDVKQLGENVEISLIDDGNKCSTLIYLKGATLQIIIRSILSLQYNMVKGNFD